MGPSDPWSPNWRPDPSGRRLRAIGAMRRGAVLAGIVYLPIAALVLASHALDGAVALAVALIGLPGIALLGAGLAPAALDSRIDGLVAGVAFAIGAPVAAVTSLVIGAFLLDGFTDVGGGLAGPILRAGVSAAASLAPVVAAAAAIWVIGVRRLTPRLPVEAPTADPDATEAGDAPGRDRRAP